MEAQTKTPADSFFYKILVSTDVWMGLSFCVGDSQNRAVKHLVIQA